MEGYDVEHLMPHPGGCMSFRMSACLSAKTFQAATVGLANLLFAVQILHSFSSNMTLGIGIIVDDGRFLFLAINMAMLSADQGKGVGR